MSSAESRVRVALTFDFDGMAPWLQVTTSSPSFISRGEFGPVGVGRITEILDEFDITGSFFTPGHTALSYPESVESLVADGHEIGHHGWVHEFLSPLSDGEERSVIERGIEALESVAGERPRGFRAPGFDLSNRTLDLLVEYEFSYDSSMMGKDFSPYWCRSGDILTSDEPFVFGDPVDLVEIPVAWHLTDVPFFEFVPGVPNLIGAGRPEEVLDIWKGEFTYLYEQAGEGCLVLTMHPQTIGRGHRISLLRKFIEFVLDHENAKFVRTDEIANRFRVNSSSAG
ncbi:MAG: polysaccharide deacetylase [Actinomycetota bacterium]|nr:polysaccharide deacetylase [Actinomycetota bacterium]